MNNVQDAISAKQANMVSYKAPSYGLFKTNIIPMYWFGIPRNVKISGLTMDVDHISHLRVHKNNDHEQWVNYNRATGARMSAMEHLVPEHKTAGAVLHSEAAQWANHMDVVNEMFSTDENPAHGISAVKAIQLAAAEGQKIWTITRANLDTALASSQLSNDIKNDIRNAVHAGKEVTAHEKPLNFYGKTSAGYIILDPTTGAGAYMISSGENGGDILTNLGGFLSSYSLFVESSKITSAVLGPWVAIASQVVTMLTIISSCPMDKAYDMVIAVTILSILTILFLGIAFASFGIFAGAIGRIAATYLANKMQETMIASSMQRKGCN